MSWSLDNLSREAGEADFRKVLTLARSMGAEAGELRPATSLARLLRETGAWMKRTRCLAKSTTGSPKASTR
jgi:hypothetical protein